MNRVLGNTASRARIATEISKFKSYIYVISLENNNI